MPAPLSPPGEPAPPRLRVALLCCGCDGEDVGESWSSFQWARGLAAVCDLTVLTFTRHGHTPTSIQLPDARVIEWPDAPLLSRFERFSAGAKPGWALLYWRARRWLRAALRRGEHFDVIHQLTPLAPRHACPVAGLGVPYLIGPLAGSLPTPPAFRAEVGAGPWYTRLRCLDPVRYRADPILRRGYVGAEAVIGVAPYVAQVLSATAIRRFEMMSETGIHALPELGPSPVSAPGDPLRLLYVGRIVRTKGLRDAVRSLALLSRECAVHLDVVGEGDDRPACESEATRLGVADRITFHGKVPRTDVDAFYRRADVFVFPSFREPSGNVVVESMSFGLPIITADNGGPGHVVSDKCGVRITPTNPDDYAAAIASAIAKLAADPDRRRRMGIAARHRIETVALWPVKIRWMQQLHAEIAGVPVAHPSESSDQGPVASTAPWTPAAVVQPAA